MKICLVGTMISIKPYPADGKCECCGYIPSKGFYLIYEGGEWLCLTCVIL